MEDGRRPQAERAFPGRGAGGGGLAGPPCRRGRPAPTTRPLGSGPPGHRATTAPQPPGAPADTRRRRAPPGATGPPRRSSTPSPVGSPSRRREIRLPPDGREAQAPPAAVAVCAGLVRQIADDLHFDQGLLATRSDISNLLSGETEPARGRLAQHHRRRPDPAPDGGRGGGGIQPRRDAGARRTVPQPPALNSARPTERGPFGSVRSARSSARFVRFGLVQLTVRPAPTRRAGGVCTSGACRWPCGREPRGTPRSSGP